MSLYQRTPLSYEKVVEEAKGQLNRRSSAVELGLKNLVSLEHVRKLFTLVAEDIAAVIQQLLAKEDGSSVISKGQEPILRSLVKEYLMTDADFAAAMFSAVYQKGNKDVLFEDLVSERVMTQLMRYLSTDSESLDNWSAPSTGPLSKPFFRALYSQMKKYQRRNVKKKIGQAIKEKAPEKPKKPAVPGFSSSSPLLLLFSSFTETSKLPDIAMSVFIQDHESLQALRRIPDFDQNIWWEKEKAKLTTSIIIEVSYQYRVYETDSQQGKNTWFKVDMMNFLYELQRETSVFNMIKILDEMLTKVRSIEKEEEESSLLEDLQTTLEQSSKRLREQVKGVLAQLSEERATRRLSMDDVPEYLTLGELFVDTQLEGSPVGDDGELLTVR